MVGQTHYQTLGVDENASREMIDHAYKRLLIDAKEKLQDSPLFTEKAQNLKHAHQVLSNQALRQSYDNKLARERAQTYAASDSGSFNAAEFFGGLVFSKAFLASAVLIIVLLVILPSGKDRVSSNAVNKHLDNQYDIHNQQMELARQREERYYESQENSDDRAYLELEREEAAEARRLEMEERRLALQEQREMERLEREERMLALKEERAARQAEYDLERQKERERRNEKYKKQREEYEARRRSQEFIRSTQRTGELQKDINRLKSGY